MLVNQWLATKKGHKMSFLEIIIDFIISTTAGAIVISSALAVWILFIVVFGYIIKRVYRWLTTH